MSVLWVNEYHNQVTQVQLYDAAGPSDQHGSITMIMTPTQLTPFTSDYTCNLRGESPTWDVNGMTTQHQDFHPAYHLYQSQ